MRADKSKLAKLFLILLMGLILFSPASGFAQQKVGVLFVVHGGFDTYSDQNMWDSAVQMFAYEPYHSVYQYVIWCPSAWSTVLPDNKKETRKYPFEYGRIGGTDPFTQITMQQMEDMVNDLNHYTCDNISFEYDWAAWIPGPDADHYPYPRFIYNGPPSYAGITCVYGGSPAPCTYCGSATDGGPWNGCNLNRYNVDGPIERLLDKGVTQIVMIDLTVGGVRFKKSFDVYTMSKRALADNGAASVPIYWINDINNLMQNSYPTDPADWTPQWSYIYKTGPNVDPSVPLSSNPNPVALDPMLITLNVDGIVAGMSPSVSPADTGVVLINHALTDWSEYFDPKIDDTETINLAVEAELLARYPDMDPDNIVGAFMGIKEDGSAEGFNGEEYTRRMRGENLGHAWLYQTAKQLPAGKWGYKYWDALEYLKNHGVQHIVIGFPQIISDSVLQLVEIPNQVAKEIGYKNWLKWGTYDYATYPGVGHPFADYWGNWVNTQCNKIGETGTEPCCFQMGGCGGSQPYPPLRPAGARADLHPSLAYDVSEFGHLGYNPADGSPDPDMPVQDQYTGTWEMYKPASADPRVGQMLARQVASFLECSISSTAIELAEFKADSGNRKVTLEWITASEIDTLGFNIYRSTEENGTYSQINAELIPSKGSPSGSAAYQFTDKAVKNRTTYWYKLEEVDVRGTSTMHGPVSSRPSFFAMFSSS